ncbi:MAG: Glycosyl transferase family 39 [Parcubacteria group bacterium GW2011_GWA1_36_12]|nr:MAG: Glycosyl transferase family 39 [Parcubacteria group bacterium GW2011_GWA1_36_12]
MMSFLSILFIFVIYWLGNQIGGKKVGGLSAIFAAIAPAQISNSLSVWNPAIVPLLSAIILLFVVQYFNFRKARDIFLFGFTLSLAMSIHFQSMLLFPTLIILLFVTRPSKKHLSYLILGLLIPFLPLIYFDIKHDWYNFKSVFIYLFIDQFSIWVPNRWLSYIFSYWPETWSHVIGGFKFLSGSIIVLLSIFTISNIKKLNNYKVFYLIASIFVLEIVLYRYRGPRYEYYSFFTHPYVLLLSAWTLKKLTEIQKLIGIIFIIAIVVATLNQSIYDLKETQISLKKIKNLKTEIYSAFPSQKFDIYSCPFSGGVVAHPLSLSMYHDGRNSEAGIGIMACEQSKGLTWDYIPKNKIPKDANYYSLSTSRVYRTTAEWWKNNPPKSSDFFDFIKRKLNPSCYPHCS